MQGKAASKTRDTQWELFVEKGGDGASARYIGARDLHGYRGSHSPDDT